MNLIDSEIGGRNGAAVAAFARLAVRVGLRAGPAPRGMTRRIPFRQPAGLLALTEVSMVWCTLPSFLTVDKVIMTFAQSIIATRTRVPLVLFS